MYLHRPWHADGQKTLHTDDILAQQFWASSWGREAAQADVADPSVSVINFLAASRSVGGLEASWDNCCGLGTLIETVNKARPALSPQGE